MSGSSKISGAGKVPLTAKIFRKTCNNLTTGMALMNRRGQVLLANASFRRIFGEIEHKNILSVPLFLQMTNLSAAGLSKHLADPQLDRSFSNAPCHNRRGERIFLSYRLKKVKKNRILCEVRDTSRERSEAALTEPEKRLIAAGEYATRVTHALKGSSLTLTSTLEFLMNNPERFIEYLPNLNQVARRISAVIEQVLKRTSEKEMKYEEVELRALFDEIKNLPDIKAKLAKGRINILISGQTTIIESDKDLLREAFVYLFENAIDAILQKSEPFGKIKIKIMEQPHAKPESVKIRIADDGPGIAPDILNKIFSPFYTTKKEGSGIGLSVAKKIIEENHGGRISVESNLNQGTAFCVFLPRSTRKEIIAQKSPTLADKVQAVRKKLADLGQNYEEFADEGIAGMTIDHIRQSEVEEMVNQIRGQIERLEEFISTGRPHLSINNFSRRTEVVLACSKDSAPRNFWENLILYELQKMGLPEEISVVGTRGVEKSRAVCRIFEIKKFRGKLTEGERTKLEDILIKKFTPIPSLEEQKTQEEFLKIVLRLMQEHGQSSNAHALIFNPSLGGPLRVATYKTIFFPEESLEIEEAVARRIMLERPRPSEMLKYLIEKRSSSGVPILLMNEKVTPSFIEKYEVGPFFSRFLAAFRTTFVLGAVFRTPQEGAVINLIGSESQYSFSDQIQKKFFEANQDWLDKLTKKVPENK